MSAVSYLFGNVDDSGKLDKREIQEDLRDTLATVEASSEYLTNILASSFEVALPSASHSAATLQFKVLPSANAVDYSEIAELAEDLAPVPAPLQYTFTPLAPQKPKAIITQERLKELFPSYIPHGRLKFGELFQGKLAKSYNALRLEPLKYVIKDEKYPVQHNDIDLFMKALPARYPAHVDPKTLDIIHSSSLAGKDGVQEYETNIMDTKSFEPVVLEPWETRIIWDAEILHGESNGLQKPSFERKIIFRNSHLEDNDWVDAVVWDDTDPLPKPPAFHLDDPHVVVLQHEVDEFIGSGFETKRIPLFKKRPDGKIIDRFNVSDDWKYEHVKHRTARVRQTYGPATLVHSLPAIMLHPQYMKPSYTTRELRENHRPTLKFAAKEAIVFAQVKSFKRSKSKEIDPNEMMKTPRDISLRDSCKFILAEYCEEYPLVVQNKGMASLIYNYYRKKNEKDNYVPKFVNGGAFILESVDASPFFGFGDIAPGETLQALYNNMFRAPVFPQKMNKTDFLIIKHTYNGITKYYIRDIPNLYTVGQNFPVTEIPRPQARKVTQSLKTRIMVAAFRCIQKDPYRRLKFEKLEKAFPWFSSEEIRNRVKEFAQYLKKGENTGWWRLKNAVPLPDEEGIRRCLTPEHISHFQTALVGQQRLSDAGFGAEDYKESANEDEDESHLDIEIQVAPWTLSKNFVIAANGKGMLQLFGAGDPTGCGLGFSFIRQSMKQMFFKQGEDELTKAAFIDAKSKATYHKYSIIEQQVVYRSEIERIWRGQIKSLSSEPIVENEIHGKVIDFLEELEIPNAQSHQTLEIPNISQWKEDSYHVAESDDVSQQATSIMGTTNKMLVVNRLIKNEAGALEWKSEIIYDRKVITAYLRYRKLIEQQSDYHATIEETRDEKSSRLRKRAKAHVSKLQMKLGKTTPCEVTIEAVDSQVSNKKLILKISSEDTGTTAKKRKLDTNPEEIEVIPAVNEQPKLVIKLRSIPLRDLASIFESVLAEIIGKPALRPFLNAVKIPGYNDIIKIPMWYAKIQEQILTHTYRSREMFMRDIKLIAENCERFNGVNHPLAIVSKDFTSLVENLLNERTADIVRLEGEILDNQELKVTLPIA